MVAKSCNFFVALTGVGPSKRIAKKNAAAALMHRLENGSDALSTLDESNVPVESLLTASILDHSTEYKRSSVGRPCKQSFHCYVIRGIVVNCSELP